MAVQQIQRGQLEYEARQRSFAQNNVAAQSTAILNRQPSGFPCRLTEHRKLFGEDCVRLYIGIRSQRPHGDLRIGDLSTLSPVATPFAK
jgi:hypothetical protein